MPLSITSAVYSNNIAQDADKRADKDDADRRWHMDWIEGWCGSAGDIPQTGNAGLFTNGDMDYGSLTYFLCLIPATFVVALISIFTAWQDKGFDTRCYDKINDQ